MADEEKKIRCLVGSSYKLVLHIEPAQAVHSSCSGCASSSISQSQHSPNKEGDPGVSGQHSDTYYCMYTTADGVSTDEHSNAC